MAQFGPLEEIMSEKCPFQEKNYDSYPAGPNILRGTTGDRVLNIKARKVIGIDDMCDNQRSAIDRFPMDVSSLYTPKTGYVMNKSGGDLVTARGMFIECERQIYLFEKIAASPGGLK